MARSRRPAVILVLALSSLMLVVSAPPAGAAWSPPGFVRSISGRGNAAVYPFAMEFNEFTNEILVGDYWNYQVRRYDLQGNQLGAFFLPPSQRHGQAYSVSSDPRNGHIYVTEFNEGDLQVGDVGWVSHWTPTGQFVDAVDLNVVYHAWAVVDGEGNLYVADSHASIHGPGFPPKIRKYDLDNAYQETASWGTWGSDPGQILLIHGMDVDPAGNLYVADAFNYRVSVYAPDGTFLSNFGSKGSAVGQFTGDLRGVAIDRVNGWIYVVDAEASEIEKFALDGTPLGHWGTEGQGPGQFADGGRGITVDNAGHVWVADFGNYRFFEFDGDGNLLNTYPDPGAEPFDGGFSQIRDVAVNPATGEVWGSDTWNHRVQKFSANGAFLGTWGFRNSHPPYGMDYPRGVAIDPATGDVWVANTRDHVIRVYAPEGTYLRTIGTGLESDDPNSFRWPMDIEFYDGRAYVAGYYARSIKVLDAVTGVEIQTISTRTNGIAIDPTNGEIFNVSWRLDRVDVFSQAGVKLRTFGSPGSGDGQFLNPWDIDIVAGTVYVTDSQLKRVQAFDRAGVFLGKWGSGGTRAYQFAAPSGITHDAAGNIYIADAANSRILVFNHSVVPPTGDTVRPTVSLGSPANGATVPAPVTVTGSAADAGRVAKVEIAIRDAVTGRWWDQKTATWKTGKRWNIAALAGANPANMTFRAGFNGAVHGRAYRVEARSTDSSGNVSSSPAPFRTFTVS